MTHLDPYITDVLLRDLVGHDRRPAAFLAYLWLFAEQQRASAPIPVSYHDLAEAIGISKSSAQSAVSWLCGRSLLAAEKATVTSTPVYTVLTPWRRDSRRTLV